MLSLDLYLLELINKFNGFGLLLYTLICIVITGVLSALIGIEREMKGQAAGLRTHVLVSIGCCFLMIISVFGLEYAANAISKTNETFNYNLDISRVAAGILSGIGFMGAGSIVKNGLSIRGLTTAATLWLVSALGMACGCGLVVEAILVTLVSMLFLLGLGKIEKLLDKGSPKVFMSVAPNIPILHEIRTQADKYRLVIKNISTQSAKARDGREQVNIIIYFAYQSDRTVIADFVESFSPYPYVYSVEQEDSKKKARERGD